MVPTIMKCVICKQGATPPGTATEVLERDGAVVVFRNVPAEVCDVCGETYLDAAIASRVQAEAEKLIATGSRLDVRDYRAA